MMPVISKLSLSARMLLPSLHLMTTAFGSIGAESNECARGLCVRRVYHRVDYTQAPWTVAGNVDGRRHRGPL